MNEAFGKILERFILESSSCKVYKLINPNKEDVAEFNAYKKCIEIVKEVAEEYNGGWIPCSERLPNQDGEFTDVLITCESMADGIFVQSAEFYITSYGEPVFDTLYHYERVLAWQPLPEPFKERD